MATVKYNAKNVYMLDGFRLIPGYNEIEDGLLKSALKIPTFQYRIDKGVIEIEGYKKAEKTLKKHKAGRRGVGTLLEMMHEIYDVAALKRYIESHKNEKVVEAAKTQLQRIEAEAEEEHVITV